MSLKLRILMALLSCAAVRAQCPAEGLADGEVKCDSCFGYTSCEGTVATATVCPDGTACYNAVCVTPDLYECVTCPAGALTACDPFNPYLVVACVAGQAPLLLENCDPALGEICQNGVCVQGTTPAPGSGGTMQEQCSAQATDPVIIPYKPECKLGLLCSERFPVISFNCTDEEDLYFDPKAIRCQSLPVDNCYEIEDGTAPSRTDCTKFVVCQGGVEVAEYDCGPGFVFDVVTNDCIDETAGPYTCADLVGCTFESVGPC